MPKASDHRPADVRDMGIVHSALRRDLRRMTIVLESDAPITDERRQALAEHALQMMHFLHNHHTGEDDHLWPAVRSRNPDAGPLLDQMDADHRRIAPAITELEAAARAYAADASARDQFSAAVATMAEVTLPHLRREELEMMPVVAETLTETEYEEIGKRAFVKPKSFAQLGREGHWILDGVDQESYDRMVSVVPPPARFVMIKAFRRGYAKKCQTLWGGTPAADVPSLSLAVLDEEQP
jgi:hemerythrin-like domain-containing protein